MYHLSMGFTIFNKKIYVKFITYHTFNSFQMFYVPTHKEKEYVIVNYLFRIYVIDITYKLHSFCFYFLGST